MLEAVQWTDSGLHPPHKPLSKWPCLQDLWSEWTLPRLLLAGQYAGQGHYVPQTHCVSVFLSYLHQGSPLQAMEDKSRKAMRHICSIGSLPLGLDEAARKQKLADGKKPTSLTGNFLTRFTSGNSKVRSSKPLRARCGLFDRTARPSAPN